MLGWGIVPSELSLSQEVIFYTVKLLQVAFNKMCSVITLGDSKLQANPRRHEDCSLQIPETSP